MTEVAKKPEDVAIERRKASASLQQDIKLSLGQSQSLPDMLMTAPLAINLLGQIKLLAFTDDALRIRLTEPRGGFQYLQRTSLSSAMIQIVDQSADAFDLAEKKMRAIRMQTNVMFGRNGHVQTILMCLQDPRRAKKDLLVSMSKFEKDMEKCAAWSKEIESQFDSLVKCAGEVNLAMAEEMTIAAEEQEQIEGQVIKAEFAEKKQANALDVLKSRVEDAQSEFTEAREQFQKTSSKGEASALFAAAAVGLGSSFTGLINATVSVFKDAPKVAIETAKAVGRVGSIGVHHHHHGDNQAAPGSGTANGQNTALTNEGPGGGLDPALLSAEQIEIQLLNLNELLNDELPDLVEEGGSVISSCAKRLEALRKSLGNFRSKHTVNACGILDEALGITADILSRSNNPEAKRSAGEWHKKITRWNKSLNSLLNGATKLRSFAASQPGQGFGDSLNNNLARTSLPPSDSTTYDRILHQRHQTLLIKRSAMNEARVHLEKQTESQLQAQAEIIDIAHKMKDLAHKQTTIEDTKRILRKAIDVMIAMQDQVRQLKGFFDALANIISIVCKGQAETYLATIEAGIPSPQDKSQSFILSHSEQQLQVIRETVITLRGHFGFVVHSADMYQDIATRHINPCIRMAANLPLSVGPAEQEQARCQLKLMTDASSKAIQRLAQEETEAYQRDLEKRVLEIEGELAALGFEPPEEGDEDKDGNLQAIEEGIKESSEEIAEEMEELGDFFEEIMDDL
ncbi:hypothetical protein B0T24DRAFT_716666 [Lasiosphaeria ovina]|uniref:Uncharacterized protein n=1 Tax=Lasiosphaeria ovina TaxID=92902 RepID=A0AAE0KM41_9PEZI|nr:hypothetical protein B0T24DRAFT_716666 [Lasiosphaeria ovina]